MEELLKQWKRDEKASFKGWDFSYLEGRKKEDKTPWNYISMAKKLVKDSYKVLDIDTGGGEVLFKIHPPKGSFAVEGYKPNVKIAKECLKRIGVNVIEANSSRSLPFKDGLFDLVLNRHGAINAKEIYRVLNNNGTFFTQQVDASTNLVDLISSFKGKPKWTFNNLKYRKKELEKLGFKVIKAKSRKGKIVFKDVGAIVYFLKSIPWLVDNFSVDSHIRYLKLLQKRLDSGEKLTFTLGNFIILAKKSKI
jgi:ubiquinone/menaquinone biosynthesis C-methylase UbiE